MTAEELLSFLGGQGFRLWIDGDELSGDGPPELLTPELLESIRLHKTELIQLLGADPPALQPKTRRQGPESWRLSNGLSIIGMEPWDFQGEDADLARLPRRDDDGWRPRISKF